MTTLAGIMSLSRSRKPRTDPSWVPGARGMVVKVIYSLLYDLPADYQYRVVFMERSMAEVLASQKKMLERRVQAGRGRARRHNGRAVSCSTGKI